MTKKIIHQDSFLISGIMCFQGCGTSIQSLLDNCVNDCIKESLLPKDARLIMDAEPNGLGIHRLFLTIEGEEDNFVPPKDWHTIISARFKENIGFEIVNEQEDKNFPSNKSNWINILINLMAITAIFILSFVFPPSLFLTIGLTLISFLSTAFTAREHLVNFFRNLGNKNLANMSTTITLGWLLSLAHTIFHVIAMPLTGGFSMIFMSFIMPVMLITFINGMDEVKRLILSKARRLQLHGIKNLFPQMSEKYLCYPLSVEQLALLSQKMSPFTQPGDEMLSSELNASDNSISEDFQFIENLLSDTELTEQPKNGLKEGTLIQIKRGECFPVDCILIKGNTVIDASLLTGESQQNKRLGQNIPAGAINLGETIIVYATKNCYNSTVNSLLFRSNRARGTAVAEAKSKFIYLYTALIIIGLAAAVVAPAVLGIITLPLLIQNVIGILFSICPCTIAIAHQLPNLISIHHRNNKGIQLRDESLIRRTDEMHTIVFDKTGTLTTGQSIVESSDISFASPLWQRIYLLEKAHGAEHPLAKAIMNCYERNLSPNIMLNEINHCKIDPQHRGLSAMVQGKLIHIGNADYLQNADIKMPAPDKSKIAQGFSPVYVAEDNIYQGAIYIKHEPRKGILEALSRLKKEGKKLIMLTGDNKISAQGFNNQHGSIFAEEDIHAGQTPMDKENFLSQLMTGSDRVAGGIWFVGDGLNDAPCCRIVTDKGGVSCAMNANDKSAFFTDICLNGSLDYLFHHNKLNRFLRQNIFQNQWILAYSSLAFLAFILGFSIAGIAVSPIIPMAIMLSATLFILFNAYRNQLSVDDALDKAASWPKKALSSNLSTGLLLGASALLICAILIATITTGGLTLPLVFTAGALTAFASGCTLGAAGLFSAFALLATSYALSENLTTHQDNVEIEQTPFHGQQSDQPTITSEKGNHTFSISRLHRKTNPLPLSNESEIPSAILN
ncbi:MULTISPECIES: HAD-IC family P-type ATPase [unclassified Legionella]|uniref:HAD-IC family P-type ATPase n=1 Tax=unclassified Legionella TaxID=2622702 RepID=UPI001055660B|nr:MULTISPECIES: HAD-IC family P-type ATPase [unclassified Legionella]MDI9818157.1 HAD-IC family P-type ATPase [Legionella sp. PL877]